MVIKINLSDEQLNKLDYCVGLIDRDNADDVLAAVQSLFDSCRETKEQLISHQKRIKSLEDKYKCMMDEQKAQYQKRFDELLAKISFMEDNHDSLEHQLDIANAKLGMVEVIFGRGAR